MRYMVSIWTAHIPNPWTTFLTVFHLPPTAPLTFQHKEAEHWENSRAIETETNIWDPHKHSGKRINPGSHCWRKFKMVLYEAISLKWQAGKERELWGENKYFFEVVFRKKLLTRIYSQLCFKFSPWGLPWRYSKAACMTGCMWHCLCSSVGSDDLQGFLPTLTILWFCGTLKATESQPRPGVLHWSLAVQWEYFSLSAPLVMWAPRLTSMKAALCDETILLSLGLPFDILSWPLLSCCVSSSISMNFPGLLRNVFELPPMEQEVAQLQGHHNHEKSSLSVEVLPVWLIPKKSIAQETCEGWTLSFQERQPEKLHHFQDQILLMHKDSFILPGMDAEHTTLSSQQVPNRYFQSASSWGIGL